MSRRSGPGAPRPSTAPGTITNWIQVTSYEDDAAPLLPKRHDDAGHRYFDNTPANRNVVDPRNWSGMGHRSIDNMLLLISPAIVLSDEEFQRKMETRRRRLNLAEGQTVPWAVRFAASASCRRSAVRRLLASNSVEGCSHSGIAAASA